MVIMMQDLMHINRLVTPYMIVMQQSVYVNRNVTCA